MRLGAAMEEEIASGNKTFGETPAWIEELVRATIEPPPPDWSAILQRAIFALSRSERSYLRPSRRMAALAGADGAWPDVVSMPGRRVKPQGRLVAVVDTSASMDAADLKRFFGALAAIASAEGFDESPRLVQADAAIARDETVYARRSCSFKRSRSSGAAAPISRPRSRCSRSNRVATPNDSPSST